MGKQNLLFSIVIAICVILTVMIQGAFAQTASSDIKALFSGERAFSHVDALEALGPRVAGSAAEQEAAEYIANEMSNYGFDVEIQQFETPYFEELSTPLLEQISPNPTSYIEGTDFATMTYSGSGDVTAPIQDVDLMMPPTGGSTSGCEAPDFAGFTAGNIALIQRGTCSYALKAQNAEAAGAVGVIIFNEGNTPDRTGIPYGTLGAPGVLIPVVGASFALGEELYNLTLGGDVTVHMIVDAISDYRTSQNIIGTKEGLDPSQGIVYMGAHYDTVSTSPGANDNASGVAALLEAARVLNLRGYTKATQKFIAFGAKEVGLDGSYNYVNENYDEITTMGIGM
ncbi:MAG: M28 family peptidase, partial [Desulfobacteraceae bacterium]|nr:M28 family peptidase [Desulfobacteraceae bacterium]